MYTCRIGSFCNSAGGIIHWLLLMPANGNLLNTDHD
ncbi:hypothetical protein SLEP1_g48752 [Rubroshorea leprosula]|uniref:Uncharacterized protein n=1 Tax=Rubroshorea leprosula TaxID=152421 RepID=A0AAV5LWY2_9ROSI|nr:hypothetical protein SLEP1_g48752 [Rubroshorea leprosula]